MGVGQRVLGTVWKFMSNSGDWRDIFTIVKQYRSEYLLSIRLLVTSALQVFQHQHSRDGNVKSKAKNITAATCFLNCDGRKEGNVLFNDALNTFYLRLYGVRHMVKDHSDSERGNPLPPHRLFFPISSKGSLICTIPQTG